MASPENGDAISNTGEEDGKVRENEKNSVYSLLFSDLHPY